VSERRPPRSQIRRFERRRAPRRAPTGAVMTPPRRLVTPSRTVSLQSGNGRARIASRPARREPPWPGEGMDAPAASRTLGRSGTKGYGLPIIRSRTTVTR
jgi:hypothetical protein